jgi:hypothetical protein
MIAWILWFFVAPHLLLFDGILLEWLPVRVDVGVATCLVLALFVRTRALPGLLFCSALGRALLLDGDLALHFLAMGLPVAVLLPLRIVMFGRAPLWHCAAAGFLALTMPKAVLFFGRLSGQSVDVAGDVGAGGVVAAMVFAPAVAWLLRVTPPLSLFIDRSQ